MWSLSFKFWRGIAKDRSARAPDFCAQKQFSLYKHLYRVIYWGQIWRGKRTRADLSLGIAVLSRLDMKRLPLPFACSLLSVHIRDERIYGRYGQLLWLVASDLWRWIPVWELRFFYVTPQTRQRKQFNGCQSRNKWQWSQLGCNWLGFNHTHPIGQWFTSMIYCYMFPSTEMTTVFCVLVSILAMRISCRSAE